MKVYKANNKKKFSVLAICLLLTALFAVSGTLAYLIASTNSVENTFTPADAPNVISEEMSGTVKSDVKVTVPSNEENVDVYIRATYVATWQNANGEIYSTMPVEGTDYSVELGTSGKWVKANGFYYYKESVAPGAETEVLIEKCEVLKAAPAEGYTLHVEILSQSVQAEGVAEDGNKAVEKAWGVDPSTL